MTDHGHAQGMLQARGEGVPQPGDIIAGKYQVERVLGRGGMGVVVAAWHTALRQRVAVKFLLPSAIALPEATERFLREAQSASAIKSEHVARVSDVGTLETGSPYIIMEYLTGTDMSALIKSRGALPIEEAVDYVLQACEAIAEAHSLGIVHRDLKPSNLFLTARADGSPLMKVLDFGLSKAPVPQGRGGVEASLTATAAVVGSPHYMSPEQMRSLKRVDVRTDIWSLGVILYEFLTSRRPFEGESLPAIFGSIAAEQPAPLRSHRPAIPTALEKAVLRCLEKSPDQRTQTVSELARALKPFGSESAAISVQRIMRVLADNNAEPSARRSTESGPLVNDSTTAVSAWSQASAPARKNVIVAIAAGAAGLVLVVAIGAVLTLRKQHVAAEPNGATAASEVASVSASSASAGALPSAHPSEVLTAAPPAVTRDEVSVTPAPAASSASVPAPVKTGTDQKSAPKTPKVKAPVKDKRDRWD